MGAVGVPIMVAVPTDTAGAGSVVMVAVATCPHSRGSWFTRRILDRVRADSAESAALMAAGHARGAEVVVVVKVASVAYPHAAGVVHVHGSCCQGDPRTQIWRLVSLLVRGVL